MDPASQAIIGDPDPSGLTNPGELHLNIAAPGANAAPSVGGFGGGVPWWVWLAVAVAVFFVVKR